MKFLKFILNIFRIIGIFNTLFLMLKGNKFRIFFKENTLILNNKVGMKNSIIKLKGKNNKVKRKE